ncbi:MAG TPA: helix-turn-helix transcriptional regulator [Accumulibacter sp.]|uniref:helix-turn-helix domain-containing protein n=1 Tax=Accumulibacter sp. TaxID=2053492 RepID=UPI002CB16859|nr:helix-turn-helix transcriptional regulator [Accumulibacter sp.]HRD88790.1 helix-turn-helix transcriptional regulator [Accumulibacter sp.]HRF73861.1 helix-turn-helix transcriptional regulator [Accumulibacter sp.]
MDEVSPLALFLKKHREALGMNPRAFAEAISSAGGQATTQAVQQWENSTPGQRTTRPNSTNRQAIAEVLACDVGEVEAAYRAARDAADGREEKDRPTTAASSMRARIGLYARFENEIAGAIRAKIPDADEYLEKVITPFGMSRRYDYLSPRLAVDWVGARGPHIGTLSLEGRLWHLLWLSRLDADTGIARKYLFILVLASDDPAVTAHIKRGFDRLRDEARVFGNTLILCLASSPAEAADLVVAHETGAEQHPAC